MNEPGMVFLSTAMCGAYPNYGKLVTPRPSLTGKRLGQHRKTQSGPGAMGSSSRA